MGTPLAVLRLNGLIALIWLVKLKILGRSEFARELGSSAGYGIRSPPNFNVCAPFTQVSEPRWPQLFMPPKLCPAEAELLMPASPAMEKAG